MIIKLVTLTRASRKADRSISISFNTMSEGSYHEMSELDALFQQHCLIAIKPSDTPFLDKEIKDLDAVDMDLEDKTKSLSKRLRNIMWLTNSQILGRNPTDKEFREYYKNEYEKLIDHYKNKLD